MAKSKPFKIHPDEIVLGKIHIIRDQKVMLDKDLADLYCVETKRLKEAVRRNRERFPEDFMFELTIKEIASLRTQIASSKGGSRYTPMAFTEQGVALLSSVLNSETAIAVNIQIIRVFARMRVLVNKNKDILLQLDKVEKHLLLHDEEIARVFKYLKELLQLQPPARDRIGFKRKGESENVESKKNK